MPKRRGGMTKEGRREKKGEKEEKKLYERRIGETEKKKEQWTEYRPK